MNNASTVRRTDYSGPTSNRTKEKEKAETLTEKAADTFSAIAGQAESVAQRVLEQGKETGEGIQEVAGNLKTAVNRSVKDQPVATLIVTAMLGFVLGALWKS